MARLNYFANKFDWDLESSDGIILDNGWLRLRPTSNVTGRYHVFGEFPVSGTIESRNIEADGITELFSFKEYASYKDVDSPGTIEYRISTDNGTTYYYWDSVGDVWAVSDTEYSTALIIDENISTLPFVSSRQLKLQCKMTPSSDGLYSPWLNVAEIGCLFRYDYLEDLKRSLKHYIEDNIQIKVRVKKRIVDSLNSIPLITDFKIISVNSAHNITQDPGRIANIYSSISDEEERVLGSQTEPRNIYLISDQVVDDVIELSLTLSAPVFLSTDAYLKVSEIPAYAVEIVSVEVFRYESAYNEYLIKLSDETYRTTETPRYFKARVDIYVFAAFEAYALAMADELDKLFLKLDTYFMSESTGSAIAAVEYDKYRDMDMAFEGKIAKRVRMVLSSLAWIGEVGDEGKLTTEIDVDITNLDRDANYIETQLVE